ncbi:MAG TPA: hypothetical protein GXX35_06825 [Thermoanaerobacterales bacterium]|nr:hypothetical protein [Thermoanaerobacterales bacterium]
MFVNWSPEKRQEIALAVLKGELDERLGQALLDGWLEIDHSELAINFPERELTDDEWEELEEEYKRFQRVTARYKVYCTMLGIPKVILYRPHLLVQKESSHYDVEGTADFPLTDAGLQYLEDVAKNAIKIDELCSNEGGTSVYVYFKDYAEARRFTKELLHVLTSTVFRKAG